MGFSSEETLLAQVPAYFLVIGITIWLSQPSCPPGYILAASLNSAQYLSFVESE